MAELLWSDVHINHAKMRELRGFESKDEMNRFILTQWNTYVKPNDTIRFLGDLSFSISVAREIFPFLNGRYKHLYIGNHDDNKIKNLGWESVQHYGEVTYKDKLFVLCHYPILSWNKMRYGSIHCHGHSHNEKMLNDGRVDVGFEATNRPVTFDEVINLLEVNT